MGLGIRSTIRRVNRAIRSPDKVKISKYLDVIGGPRRLHIGCGEHLLAGWLNCDLLDGWMNEKMMRGHPQRRSPITCRALV
jgi:hypothetical protein